MKAYKVFDKEWKCRNFQYEFGVKYKHEGDIRLCESGFHSCKKLIDCFNYYRFGPSNKVAIVEISGETIHGDDKSVSAEIELIEEISWNDVLNLVNSGRSNSGHSNSGHSNSGNNNSGHSNSGYSNSGDNNSGYRNSGDMNSGYRNSGNSNSGHSNSGDNNSGHMNSGHSNSGNWNSCNRETGFFNSKQDDYINVFNKKCKKEEWVNAQKPYFIYDLVLNEWVWFNDMNEDEKKEHPEAYACDGFLKKYEYKEAWGNAYANASYEDIELLKALPNFDAEIFEEITGIKIK